MIYKIRIKIKSKKDLPDWGLGPGILAEQEVELKEELTEENRFLFEIKMHELYEDLVNDTIEPVYEKI